MIQYTTNGGLNISVDTLQLAVLNPTQAEGRALCRSAAKRCRPLKEHLLY